MLQSPHVISGQIGQEGNVFWGSSQTGHQSVGKAIPRKSVEH